MDELPKVGKRTLLVVSSTNRHSDRLLAKAMERLTAKQPSPAPQKSSEQRLDQSHTSCKEACA